MKWAWKIGRLLGVDVFVHATFVLLLGWIAVTNYVRGGTLAAAAYGLAFTLAIFGTIVLHELGHALAARRFGVHTREITLLPIGGVARLERTPDRPIEELLVSIAGPAVNLAIALVAFVLLRLTGGEVSLHGAGVLASGPFLATFLWINVALAGFNLLPAFPMDGGRALRALLAMRTSYVRATQIAARLGQGFALALGVAGLFSGNPFLVFVAFFVWIGAANESASVEGNAALEGMPIHAAMQTEFRVLAPTDTLGTAVTFLLAGAQADFPVVGARGELAGLLARGDLVRGLKERGLEATVGELMTADVPTAEPSEMLAAALGRLSERGGRSMPVVSGDRVVGLVTLENVAELMMVRSAIRSATERGVRGHDVRDDPRHEATFLAPSGRLHDAHG